MPYLNIILGKPFYDLLQHGREIDRAIARRDGTSLNHSTPELERYFSRPPRTSPAKPISGRRAIPTVLSGFCIQSATIFADAPAILCADTGSEFLCTCASGGYCSVDQRRVAGSRLYPRAEGISGAISSPLSVNGGASVESDGQRR